MKKEIKLIEIETIKELSEIKGKKNKKELTKETKGEKEAGKLLKSLGKEIGKDFKDFKELMKSYEDIKEIEVKTDKEQVNLEQKLIEIAKKYKAMTKITTKEKKDAKKGYDKIHEIENILKGYYTGFEKVAKKGLGDYALKKLEAEREKQEEIIKENEKKLKAQGITGKEIEILAKKQAEEEIKEDKEATTIGAIKGQGKAYNKVIKVLEITEIDINKLSKTYLIVNEKLIKEMLNSGTIESIAGVKHEFKEEIQVAIRTK